jgi:hypothetical protein
VKSTVSQWRLSEDDKALLTPAGVASRESALYVSTLAGLEVVKGRLEKGKCKGVKRKSIMVISLHGRETTYCPLA